MTLKIERQIRATPQVGVTPYRQVHAHSTANRRSTAQNEADYLSRKDLTSGFFTHVVGNGRIIQIAETNRGAWDVGGGWNAESYASVELIESHQTKEEFMADYRLYVELLRQLAKEAGLPTTLDAGSTGILSHAYCTAHQPNNSSDHSDPYPYLAIWGITKDQFARDLANGFDNVAEILNNTGDEDMTFIFNIKDDKNWNPHTIYLYNGQTNEVKGFHNPDELHYFKMIYKDTTGKDVKFYAWSSKAPIYARVFGVLQPTSVSDEIKKALSEIKILISK